MSDNKRSSRRRTRRPRFRRRVQGSQSTPMFGSPTTQLLETPPVRFAELFTLSSDSKGVVSASYVADPASTGSNFSEYAGYQGLYGEIKWMSLGIQVSPASSSFETKNPVLICGSTLTSPIGSPTPALISQLSNSQLVNISQMADPRGFRYVVRAPNNLVWAETSTDPSNSIAAGVMQATIYLEGTGFPTSSDVATVLLVGYYRFRSRQ